MYKFYQEGSSENEKNEDPEGVKKEQDAYNATKTLLPGLFSEIKNVLYTPKQDYSLGVDNKINKLNVDNKNEKVSVNILEEFKNKGLYVASDINGRYIITRRQLEQEKYDELRELFNNMDNWGFQPGDDRTRDNYAPIRFIWEKIKEKMQ
jgi:hypothetical protein